jgi:hypothetical protein
VNRFGKESRRQTSDVQVFDGNPAEVQDKPVRQLVLKVSPLVPNVLVRHLQQQNGFSGHRRTLLPVVVVRQSTCSRLTSNSKRRRFK